MGMGEFNSEDHYYIYYCGQESLRSSGIALIVSKKDWNALLGCNLKKQNKQRNKKNRMTCLFPRQTVQHHSYPSLCYNHWCQRSWSWTIIWRPTQPSTTIRRKKKNLFHYMGLEWKSRKSRDTWSNRQVWPWSTKWSRANDNRILPRQHTGHRKHPFPTTQEMTLCMDLTKWSILKSDCYYCLRLTIKKLYTANKNKIWRSLWFRSWAPHYKIQT